MPIENSIIDFLKVKEGYVFCIKDMLQFGEYKSVAKAIERLEKKRIIDRVINGIYYYPKFNDYFNMKTPPNIEKVVESIARNFDWKILSSGNTALNQLGISTQISSKYIYISNGQNRKYLVGKTEIIFKSASQSNFFASKKVGIVVQGLKALKKENITSIEIKKIASLLEKEEKEEILKYMKQTPIWMHKYLKEICNIDE